MRSLRASVAGVLHSEPVSELKDEPTAELNRTPGNSAPVGIHHPRTDETLLDVTRLLELRHPGKRVRPAVWKKKISSRIPLALWPL